MSADGAETTFDVDLSDAEELAATLWPLCERVAARLRQSESAARTVVLKLKTADFRIATRRHRLEAPTQLAEMIYRTALPLLVREADGRQFRLIGIGGSAQCDGQVLVTDDMVGMFERVPRFVKRYENLAERISAAAAAYAAEVRARTFPGKEQTYRPE